MGSRFAKFIKKHEQNPLLSWTSDSIAIFCVPMFIYSVIGLTCEIIWPNKKRKHSCRCGKRIDK